MQKSADDAALRVASTIQRGPEPPQCLPLLLQRHSTRLSPGTVRHNRRVVIRMCHGRGQTAVPGVCGQGGQRHYHGALPEDLVFRTKGQLAIDICTEAFDGKTRLDFVCGDEVYGACTKLREFFEARGQWYVLRVSSSFRLTLAAGVTPSCAEMVTRSS